MSNRGPDCHCGIDGHPLNSTNCPVHKPKVMSGQEWYDRFEKEFNMRASWIAADESMGEDAEHDVMLAAKKAAGIES